MFRKHYAPTDVNQALNFGGGGGGGGGGERQTRCERRSEVFVKIQNKTGGRDRVGVSG